MNWSYTWTPYVGSTKVRALIGDVNSDDQMLNDIEIDAMLSVFPNEIEAAAHLCLSLAARFAIEGDLRVDGYHFENLKKAEFFKELSTELFRQVHGTSRPIALATVSYGGVSQSGKDLNRANTDNVRPAFRRKQFEETTALNDELLDE